MLACAYCYHAANLFSPTFDAVPPLFSVLLVVKKKNALFPYYRKRGSASYIVREVQSVRERKRERERERETEVLRRK